MIYRYETHLHTFPVSKCGHATVRESLEYYKSAGYDGVFVTNHFVDGNINYDRHAPYEELIAFYLTDYYEAEKIGKEIGLKVFFGVESTYSGTDFLIYGLTPEWFIAHPEIHEMRKQKPEQLAYFREAGALVIHAHPFREADYIPYIRLMPRSVDGVEIINANRSEFENEMAKHYAESYGLLVTAGTDNHRGPNQTKFAGMQSDTPIEDVADFIRRVRDGSMELFYEEREISE
ncbi:MAG: histidinol-phosphatase [Clostridia bacterium]|nr:histidinol-phosphatase [Clostridia bacterium]